MSNQQDRWRVETVCRQAKQSPLFMEMIEGTFVPETLLLRQRVNFFLTTIRQIQQHPFESLQVIQELRQDSAGQNMQRNQAALSTGGRKKRKHEAVSSPWAGLSTNLQRGRIYNQLEVWFKERSFSRCEEQFDFRVQDQVLMHPASFLSHKEAIFVYVLCI